MISNLDKARTAIKLCTALGNGLWLLQDLALVLSLSLPELTDEECQKLSSEGYSSPMEIRDTFPRSES